VIFGGLTVKTPLTADIHSGCSVLPERHRGVTSAGFSLTKPSRFHYAISLARQALDLLPETEVFARAGAIVATTLAYQVSGDVTLATEREVAAVHALKRTWDNPFTAVSSITLLARLHVLQGRLRQAAATYAQVVQVVSRPEVLQTLYVSLYYYFGLGDLLREWNELDAAERHLAQGILSVNTVKRHVYNLCGKLGVQSRAQAIVRARILNLL
jgi:ATP/maltotriose-dependent transcriptional regulator MalT